MEISNRWNGIAIGRKKRAKIEAFKKRGVPIVVKIQSGIFLSEKARAQLNRNIKYDRANRNPIVEREVPLSIPIMDLTEDDPPSLPCLDLEFSSPSYSSILVDSPHPVILPPSFFPVLSEDDRFLEEIFQSLQSLAESARSSPLLTTPSPRFT